MTYEVNFDGIVGPTHNYSGLSYGNLASTQNKYHPSNPKEAALQGLQKMKFLADLGLKQAVLPPHERPHLPSLRTLGFTGSDAQIVSTAAQQAPELLFNCSSAAAMWCANAATVCPSIDSIDKRVHFTAANLTSKFHRSIEAHTTSKVLQAIFKNPSHFCHHHPLPACPLFADEGAANHSRFCMQHGKPGVQLFVFGRYGFESAVSMPHTFPARQSYEASLALARLHTLSPTNTIFAQQSPQAIDAGAFHNDVVCVGNENLFFFHELAFANKQKILDEIQEKTLKNSISVSFLEVKQQTIPLNEAISSYLFNSQILSLPNGSMILLAPNECQENPRTKILLEELVANTTNPIEAVHFLNLRQSMHNGGGPACLRLRIVLNAQELQEMHPHILFNDTLYNKLITWVSHYYRDHLEPHDLADPALTTESQEALDKLTQILQLGPLYSFQT